MPVPADDDNAILYRQVGKGGDPIYFDPTRSPVVHQSLFLPSKNDSDGLSLIQSKYRSKIWAAHRPENSNGQFRLACLQCGNLRQMGLNAGFEKLTLVPCPDALDLVNGSPYAHCVIEEINRVKYDTDQAEKIKIKEWSLQVANSLSDYDILGPFQAPTDQDAYRPSDFAS